MKKIQGETDDVFDGPSAERKDLEDPSVGSPSQYWKDLREGKTTKPEDETAFQRWFETFMKGLNPAHPGFEEADE